MAVRLDPDAHDHAQALIDAGLWVRIAIADDDGWQFHDWENSQPVRNEVESRRESERKRKASWREAKSSKASADTTVPDVSQRDIDGTDEGTGASVPQGVRSSRPDPTRPIRDMRIASDDAFEAWWKSYPRKKDRGHAEKAFRKAIKLTDIDTLIAATTAYARSVADKDPEYIAYGATWLNGKRWTDEDLEPVTDRAINDWLRKCWESHDTKAIEDRSGLVFQAPDIPADIDDVREFTLAARRDWITDNRDDIIRRIMAREANAA
ncbi:hypothetical protein [Rhodococcus jostii]|uniref:hypothetical protein n=1 Tax=Rhodococcus jostii TaxID=132919 RepID=UPI003639ED69